MKVDTFAKLSDTGFKVEVPWKALITVQGRPRQGSDGGKCRLWGPLLCVSRKAVLHPRVVTLAGRQGLGDLGSHHHMLAFFF